MLRADKSKISIGHLSNIQDRVVINTVASLESGFSADVEIGEFVTVGHGALLTYCVVGNLALIGQGAIIQEGSEIGASSIIAAGAVVLPGTVVPQGQLWAGNPAVYIRDVDEEEIAAQKKVG